MNLPRLRRHRALGLPVLAALLLLLPVPASRSAAAQDAASVDWTADDAVCRCRAGNGCWHYLKSPADPPADACWCNFCEKVSRHDGTRAMPEGWSPTCASGNDMDCFLHRHALSWGMICSERWEKKKCCNLPHWENCPRCEKDEPLWGQEEQDIIARRKEREIQAFANRNVVVVWSPHFYVVTDIPYLKIRTKGGSYRVAGTHELAHIYAERAEKAYREFIQHFGSDVTLSKPSGIYLTKRKSTADDLKAKYCHSPKTHLIYGGSNDGRMADGFTFNGFVASLQESGGGDEDLHHTVRHQVGHILVSCWTKVDGQNRVLPRWVFEGTAHWLSKRHPLLRDLVVWCADEGTPLSGSGKGWEVDARKIAASNKTVPVERLLGKSTIGLLDKDDHVRSWSYFELCLAEDRERFVNVLRALRQETPVRQAWLENMGCSPEEWDQRWKDRVLGRRPTMGELVVDKGDEEGPGAAERRAIRNETDMDNLAARIRSIGVCSDPRTAAVLVEQFARDSELVRETLSVLLSKTTDPATLKAIREAGLPHGNPLVRAYTARVLGLARDKEAAPGFKEMVADKFWLARAEAALGLMRIGDPELVAAVRPLLSDGAAKVRIAALDAVGSAGTTGERVLSLVAANLDHGAWQVRSAAVESLGAIGSMAGVDPLITRMETEAGRIRRDCESALKRVTRDDLGKNPKYWRDWWSREKERAGGGIPDRPEPPPNKSYDEEHYGITDRKYGLEVFSDRVGYVLDMSNSMFNSFEPDPAAMKRLRRTYKGATKFDISREEIVQSVLTLDPRARFNILVFSNRPRFMANSLLPAAPDNQKKAESFLRSVRSAPSAGSTSVQLTSFYDAFRSVFDLPKSTMPPADFKETPDTMFFLTDGEPTTGEIVDADALLAWFNGLNRYARIRVHVVAYGRMGIDLKFLTHLAEDNGGEIFQVEEASAGSSEELPGSTPK